MSFLILSYHDNEEYSDVLDYGEIAKSMIDDTPFYPRIIELPSCKHERTQAQASWIDPTAIKIVWSDCEINQKCQCYLGELTLRWWSQKQVLIDEPKEAVWAMSDGGLWYPTWALIKSV